ncbi:ABC-2 type transport system ATP-binding protein [Mycobacterium sp. BK558]|nr:ABC-2 type transport system ATP-binding protein [Mycobacterium sp. BK558]
MEPMGAGSFVGRVGGLAVALGIGAAIVAGAGVAVADDGGSASDTSSTSVSSGSSTTTDTVSAPARTAPTKTAAEKTDDGTPDAGTRPARKRHKLSFDKPAAKADKADADKAEKAPKAEPDEPAAAPEPVAAPEPAAEEKPTAVVEKPSAEAEQAAVEVEQDEPDTPVRATTTLFQRLAAKHADADTDEDPALPALASLVMSVVTAGREATNETPTSVGDLTTTSRPDGYPIPTGVTVEEVHPPLLWLQNIPVVGTFIVTPIVSALHAIPLVGDFLQPIIGFPIDHFAPPGTPQAKSYRVTSFDGTEIFVNFMPSLVYDENGQAPTVLDGPGLGLPGPTTLNLRYDSLLPHDVIGIGLLREQGYNVVSWDPRGEWRSGGRMQLQSPDFEGRDISSIISWLATRPDVALDGINDPKIGMVGASYGGGIQLASAVYDHRIDAIVPTIAWNSLTDVLFPREAVRSGWATLLSSVLVLTLSRPNERILPAAIRGILFGTVDPADVDLLNDRGYADRLGLITTPTLLFQGTVDTLFTLNQTDANAKALIAAGTTTKVVWYCGGHGACVSTRNDGQLVIDRTLAWLDHYVKDDATADTGPQFEWTDQNGEWYSSDTYPVATTGTPLTGERTDPKTIPFVPFIGGSGPQPRVIFSGLLGIVLGLPSAAPALNAVNLEVPAATEVTHIVGAPELTLTYSGTGTATHVYAQIVDDKTRLVLGNQATPIPVVLDGQTHTVTYSLEQVAHTLQPGQSVTVQIVTSTIDFLNFYSWGRIDVEGMSVSLPTLAANAVQETVAA